jgi:4-hydroxy-4-methyl-2-oxoglutarate aldolase
VRVESGDVVVGDRDGVVIVPQAQAVQTLARLKRVRAAEVDLEAAVKNGLKVPAHIQALLDSDRIGWVD